MTRRGSGFGPQGKGDRVGAWGRGGVREWSGAWWAMEGMVSPSGPLYGTVVAAGRPQARVSGSDWRGREHLCSALGFGSSCTQAAAPERTTTNTCARRTLRVRHVGELRKG